MHNVSDVHLSFIHALFFSRLELVSFLEISELTAV
jgi:hypothetical protein